MLQPFARELSMDAGRAADLSDNCTMPMHGSFQTGRPLVLSSVLLQVFRFEGTLLSCALYMYSMSGELFSYR